MIEWILVSVLLGLNVFFVFYLKWLLKNFSFLSENVYSLLESVDTFSNHLSAVYELETFYGDETLQNLLLHAKQVSGEIKIYKDIYTLTNSEEELGDLFNDAEETEEPHQEEEQ
tara:strand:- start:221 stop:562 length:342 start_codon:yes stop_codon:yes gene_type:complete